MDAPEPTPSRLDLEELERIVAEQGRQIARLEAEVERLKTLLDELPVYTPQPQPVSQTRPSADITCVWLWAGGDGWELSYPPYRAGGDQSGLTGGSGGARLAYSPVP